MLEAVEISRLTRGIDDEKQMVTTIGNHQIIFDPASVVREQGIALTPLFQANDIDRNEPFQRRRRIGNVARFRTKNNLPHVTDIEQSGTIARVQVFFHQSKWILQRHVIPRERSHPRAKFDMQRVKGGREQF